MKNQSTRLLMSFILIGLGVVILLNNLGLLPASLRSSNWFWVAVFAIIGGSFLAAFAQNPREQWWATIPSFTLFGLAFLVGNFWFTHARYSNWIGPTVFLSMIGLSFTVILLVRPDQWWAIFPSGSLFSVAAVVAASSLLSDTRMGGLGAGAVLFLGLSLTFLLAFLRPVDGMRMTWALWPAGILGLMGMMLLLGLASMINYIWALALIAGGGLLLARGVKR